MSGRADVVQGLPFGLFFLKNPSIMPLGVFFLQKMGNVRMYIFRQVHPVKIRINLGTFRIAFDAKFLHADNIKTQIIGLDKSGYQVNIFLISP